MGLLQRGGVSPPFNGGALGGPDGGFGYREHPERDDPLLVQPRVLARTSEVTRAIVEIRTTVAPTSVDVTVPTEEAHGGGRTNITEKEFLESLATHAGPAAADFARWILSEAPNHGLEIAWKAAGPLLLYREPESGATFNLGQLHRLGQLRIDRLFGKCRKLGLPPEICRAYLDEVAAFIPGASRRFVKTKPGDGYEQVAMSDAPSKGQPPIASFTDQGPAWFAAIEQFKQTIDEEFAGRED